MTSQFTDEQVEAARRARNSHDFVGHGKCRCGSGGFTSIGHGQHQARAALEAATRVPVQGEPNDDREALRKEFEYRIRTAVAYGSGLGYRELPVQERADWIQREIRNAVAIASRTTVPDAALAEAKKQLGEIQRHFTAIAGSGEIRVYEDTGEKHGIDYQSSVWAKRGERMTRDLIEFLGEHHRPEPVGNGESK